MWEIISIAHSYSYLGVARDREVQIQNLSYPNLNLNLPVVQPALTDEALGTE